MAMCLKGDALPRLVYIGDVPVQRTTHGSGLLYRLLQDYPPERLIVVEGWPALSDPARRLPGVAYRQLALWPQRGRTRLKTLAVPWLILSAPAYGGRLRRSLSSFDPEAVLTVAENYAWLAAAQLAKDARLPLHLIVHDHWVSLLDAHPAVKPRLERLFGGVYRRAASRLCVSPFMEEEYRRNYGVGGEVLYPSRPRGSSRFDGVPQSYTKNGGPLVGAYAGRIMVAGYARLIADVAKRLEERGGSLLLYGPYSPQDLKRWGLDRQNVFPQGLTDPTELIARLRKEADFLLVPMSFDAGGANYNMRVSFPSKLVDYTSTGLPLLIWGPGDCSAVRWAQVHAPVAEVVTSDDLAPIDAALERLEQPQHRERLGAAAAKVGEKLFAYENCVGTFFRALANGRQNGGHP
jgi:glycosyltransferase involved in cell wall biosynthesis